MHIWQFVCIVDMFFLLSVEQTGRNSQMNAVNVNKRCRKHDSNHNQRIVVVRINFHTTWRRVIHPKEVKKNVYDCIYLYRKQKTINRQTMASDNFIRIKMRSSVYAISFTIETIKHWHIITSWQKKNGFEPKKRVMWTLCTFRSTFKQIVCRLNETTLSREKKGNTSPPLLTAHFNRLLI